MGHWYLSSYRYRTKEFVLRINGSGGLRREAAEEAPRPPKRFCEGRMLKYLPPPSRLQQGTGWSDYRALRFRYIAPSSADGP